MVIIECQKPPTLKGRGVVHVGSMEIKDNGAGYFDEDKNPVGYEVDFGFSEFYDEEDAE